MDNLIASMLSISYDPNLTEFLLTKTQPLLGNFDENFHEKSGYHYE